jgi:ComF family protein
LDLGIRHLFDALASVAIPAPCRICGSLLENASSLPICGDCLDRFEPIVHPICIQCGRPFGNPSLAEQTLSPLCWQCLQGTYGFDVARAYALYDAEAHHAILLLKFEEIRRLGKWFAERLAEIVEGDAKNLSADVVVPVPLHRARQRQRGYNQAALIAEPLARRLRIPCKPQLLIRMKARPEKLVLTHPERWDAVRGAYSAPLTDDVCGRRIIVVDDVFTSGATMDACARTLRAAGAERIVALTATRALSPDLQ